MKLETKLQRTSRKPKMHVLRVYLTSSSVLCRISRRHTLVMELRRLFVFIPEASQNWPLKLTWYLAMQPWHAREVVFRSSAFVPSLLFVSFLPQFL